ncbi:MAG: SWIM zinc finger family protein [Anaerolineales bacterium]
MGKLDKFNLTQLRKRYGGIPSKGQDYFEQGRVHDRIRTSEGLRARVEGTYTYSVRIRERGSDLACACSCPYQANWGGECKHIQAVLLAWIKEPETFKRVADWRGLLARKSKDELLEILIEVLEAYPHLVDEMALEAEKPEQFKPEAAIRAIFGEFEGEGLDLTETVERLDRIARRAEALREHKPDAARKIYFALIKGCVDFADQYGAAEMFMDSEVPAAYAEAYAAIVQEQGLSPTVRKELKTLHKSEASELLGVEDALSEIEDADE